MSRLLGAGFSRLKKSKCFWGFMIFMFLFGGYLRIAEFYNQERYDVPIPLDSGFFTYVTVIGILLSAFISLFIGTEYNDGTIRNKLVIGHTRVSIYLSNLIVCLTAGLLMCLSFLCASLLIGIPLLSPFSIETRDIVVMVLVSFMMSFAFTGLLTLTAMICQSRAVTAVINILAVFFLLLVSITIMSGLNQPEVWESYSYTDDYGNEITVPAEPNPDYPRGALRDIMEFCNDFLPSGQVMQLSMMSVNEPALLSLYSAGILLVSTGVGIFIFRKENIK
ncbi:MAG TPA: ABC transporter permease [Candidatus Mediterraneibacter avicola]|nr:ABC transporter permease [Candidatus Mediterraneibacter avicola]